MQKYFTDMRASISVPKGAELRTKLFGIELFILKSLEKGILLSPTYERRKFCNTENFRFQIFDWFTPFWEVLTEHNLTIFGKCPSVC